MRILSHRADTFPAVRTIGNLLWLCLAGLWLAMGYVMAGLFAVMTIVAIPFGIQAFKLAGFALWPFGRAVVRVPQSSRPVSFVANVVWFLCGGFFLVMCHVFAGLLLMLTIVGIPLGVASFKMAELALAPFGKQVVSLTRGRIGAPVVVSVKQLPG